MLLRNFPVTNDNFKRAWTTLIQHYENKRLIVSAQFSTFTALPKMKTESATELRRIYHAVVNTVESLKAIGRPVTNCSDLFVHIVADLLDNKSRREWEESVGDTTEPPALEELIKFLKRQHQTLAALSPSTSESTSKKSERPNKTARAHHARSLEADRNSCPLCAKTHYVLFCSKYNMLSANERKELINKTSRCLNCLGRHPVHECKSSKSCSQCSKRHHSSMHDAFESEKVSVAESTSRATAHVSHRTMSEHSGRLLATALVKVADRFGTLYESRALIDQCSEVSLISESLARKLRLQRSSSSLSIVGVGSASSGVTRGCVHLTVHSRFGNPCVRVVAFILRQLTSYGRPTCAAGHSWPHLKSLELADPEFLGSNPVELILGTDAFSHLVEEGVRKGKPGEPIALKTSLGWIVSGEASSGRPCRPASVLQCSVSDTLSADVRRFWEQEEPPRESPLTTLEEERCLQHYETTHSRQPDGRYVVRLPLAAPPPDFADTRKSAARMLLSTEQRFRRDSAFHSAYQAFMTEYENLGHMTPVPPADLTGSSRVCFLPHHGVLRKDGAPSKLRVVFNGSQQTREGHSLNNSLMVGPNLLPRLADVLLGWRRHQFVYVTDVEKMYRQILVHPEDRDLQRVVWRSGGQVQEFQLNTVTYGLASAPFLAIQTLLQLSRDEGDKFPIGAAALKHDVYVDDILTGASSISEALGLRGELEQICRAGGFPLKKWAANDDALLEGIPDEHRAIKPAHTWTSRDCSHSTLGVEWRPADDCFSFIIRSFGDSATTKRGILSQAAQLFDPLGWMSPVTIQAKCIIQSTWLKRVGWDDRLPDDDVLAWRAFCEELPLLTNLRIPRWLGISSPEHAIEIHGFADASEHAYAATLYMKASSGCRVKVSLLLAKTKVAPLKQVSLPRLELCAAALLATITAHALSIFDLPSSAAHLWTDSSVALGWIQGHPRQWTTFVANRVAEIQRLLPDSQWHHVPGESNPADCASRGISPKALLSHPLWWQGPSFIVTGKWPTPPTGMRRELPEKRKAAVHLAEAHAAESDLLTRHSSLSKLLRVTAWMRRWRARHRRQETLQDQTLTPDELLQAEHVWIRHVQSVAYAAEMRALAAATPLPPRTSLTKLSPFVDAEGILRVGGRLKHALLSYDERHPIIMPPSSHLTRLIIEAFHKRALHGGVQLTLSLVRRKYWVLKGRQLVRRHTHLCPPCVRWRAASPTPLMSNLPGSRVTPCRPFLKTGIDYAGPFMVRSARGRGHKASKGYIVVFVCFSSRAVHLEIASDYSTDAFLAAFRRFTSRRGVCTEIYSDCGTNFVGADAQLRALFRASSPEMRDVTNQMANHGTQWRFNPPGAPHFGGLWEAAVKSVKHHLRRVVGAATLTYEEMTTLLAQIEACLNSRPLQALSDDPDDVSALTPGHFLIGEPLCAVPEPSLAELPGNRLDRWQLVQQMRDHLWQRWSQEYLSSLIARSKWTKEAPRLVVGQLCLVRSELTSPTKWPLARITELHPGEDGRVRVITVRTATSTLTRPAVKIVPLPTTTSEVRADAVTGPSAQAANLS